MHSWSMKQEMETIELNAERTNTKYLWTASSKTKLFHNNGFLISICKSPHFYARLYEKWETELLKIDDGTY